MGKVNRMLDRKDEKNRGFADGKKAKELAAWIPKTAAGKRVKDGEITSLDQFLLAGNKVMEPEIVDTLLSDIDEQMIDFKKTTRVTRSGRVFSFRATVLIGNRQHFVGVGTGKDKERYPAMRKAAKNAKLAIWKVNRGCGSWECGCSETHSVPFRVEGKSASVRVILMPAPKGTGLVVGDNVKEVLRFSGIKDVWCKTFGNTSSKLDFVKATIDALSKTTKMQLSDDIAAKIGGKS